MKLTDICKSYDGRPVLEHTSLSFEEGKIYALMGPSGRGKTTLLHILMGLDRPDSGDLTDVGSRQFSAVFQENRLCEFLTAAENIAAVQKPPMHVSRLNAILSEILPEESLSQPVQQYSGGMKRRAAIARAVLVKSDVLIMDEPLTGLDEATRSQVISFILKYRDSRTLLFTTHQEEEVRLFGAQKILL